MKIYVNRVWIRPILFPLLPLRSVLNSSNEEGMDANSCGQQFVENLQIKTSFERPCFNIFHFIIYSSYRRIILITVVSIAQCRFKRMKKVAVLIKLCLIY